MDQTFFALSRDNAALLTELNLCFPPGAFEDVSSHRFDWQRGEFCAFLVQQFTSTSVVRLIFGRDVFGRKSLCWRVISRQLPNGNTTFCPEGCAIDENGDDGGGGTFQLSVLPGRLSDGENDDTDGWEEVPPGNIILLTLPPFSTLKTVPNAKTIPSTTTLLDLHCHLPSMNAFLSQTLCVHTFYPHDYVNENCLFKTFKGSTFTTATGAEHILLGTSEIGTTVTDLQDNAQISAATEEFVSRFASAVQGILLYVPRLVDSAKGDDLNSGFDVSVLFSGGVDSLMVALMAGEVLFQRPSGAMLSTKHGESGEQQLQQRWAIRLFSVAFGDNEKDFNEATDRAQSIAAYEYLKSRSVQKYGFNAFTLVLVNVDRDELIECRHRHIAEAIAPSKTVSTFF
uniref:Asparagine synthetase domain-containing protein n=1 Tax=Globodera rostochiensis TaxID=31243 RepID=A0A914GPY6_GLORO